MCFKKTEKITTLRFQANINFVLCFLEKGVYQDDDCYEGEEKNRQINLLLVFHYSSPLKVNLKI